MKIIGKWYLINYKLKKGPMAPFNLNLQNFS